MNKNKSKALVLATMIAAAFVGSQTLAAPKMDPNDTNADNGWHARFEKECATDVHQFCADIKPGEGKVMECLNQHETDLSKTCMRFREEAREHFEAMKADFDKACKDDVMKFCNDVTPGKGRLADCLKVHENSLSQTCKDETKMMRGMHHRNPASKK